MEERERVLVVLVRKRVVGVLIRGWWGKVMGTIVRARVIGVLMKG